LLILDPFIRGASKEQNRRAALEQHCRRKLPFELNAEKLGSYLETRPEFSQTPMLADIVLSLDRQLKQASGQKNFSAWSDLFAQWFEICGWPGDETMDSEQHQIIDALHKQVTAMRSLDTVSGVVDLDTALARLRSRLAEQPFQTESTGCRLEILGVSESSGIEFDAIWFAGMNENEWPPALDTSPLIPLSLQKESGYHGACLENNLAYATMLHKRLMHQADKIVFSRICFDKEVALYPGPLFRQPGEPDQKLQSSPLSLFRQLQQYAPEMERYCDNDSIPLATSSPKGGTRIIENQAACPFRAFARHRLGADDREPRDQGLDPADRGQLVHKILEAVWKQVRTSAKLLQLTDQQLDQMLADCISTQTRKYYRTSGVKSGFFDAQSGWLKKLLLEWLDVEKHRRLGFSVVATEAAVTLELEEMALSLQIDRIDELEDGSIALIDYKTGNARPVGNWVGERPKYPQLALYALSLYVNSTTIESRELSALLVGQLRIGNSSHTGFVLGDSFYDDTYSGRKVPALDKTRIDEDLKTWPAICSHWHSTLGDLARQFRQGRARVDPVDESACRICNLHTFCRIADQQHDRNHDYDHNQCGNSYGVEQ
jgi:probable DNA repair protein